VAPHRVYSATLTGLRPGAAIPYRVLEGGKSLFEAQARKGPGHAYRYVVYFRQPRNGPALIPGGKHATPIEGTEAEKQAFLLGAGPDYPRLANFSFDYGDSHWTAIDSNEYVDWDDPALRRWLEADIRSATGATWRFVTFHHPGMSSSHTHFDVQHMRKLAPLFERNRVDVDWMGHVHNYERSMPLRFKPASDAPRYGRVSGDFTLDRRYDGTKITRADGVLYIVTGGGGQHLYDPEQQTRPSTWQPFTTQFVATQHSLTVADVEGERMTVRQVTEAGARRPYACAAPVCCPFQGGCLRRERSAGQLGSVVVKSGPSLPARRRCA
jgi:hypothetical protein